MPRSMMEWQEGGLRERLLKPMRSLIRWQPVRRVARAVYNELARRNGVRQRIDGRVLRFALGAEPQLAEPPRDNWTAYADWVFTRAFYQAVKPGDWVADVGAFKGTYSVLAAVRTGSSGHVTAFEPVVESHADLRRVVDWNGISDRVTISDSAVSDRRGEIAMFSTGDALTNSLYESGIPASNASVNRRTVRTIDLDSYFTERGRLPDVLKIDVEGAEFPVLRGAERILASDATVFCEMHPYCWAEAGYSQEELMAWLEARGRRAIDLRTGSPIDGTVLYGPYVLERMSHSA